MACYNVCNKFADKFPYPAFLVCTILFKGVAPKEIKISDIYFGVIPYIFIQILTLMILFKFPEIITWLPSKL